MRAQVSLAKPILITQTAVHKERIRWGVKGSVVEPDVFQLEFDDQVIGAIYFNRDKNFDYRVLIGGQLDQAFRQGYASWSAPSEVSWIFDGCMDSWVRERERGSARASSTPWPVSKGRVDRLAAEGITVDATHLRTRLCRECSHQAQDGRVHPTWPGPTWRTRSSDYDQENLDERR